MERRIHAGLKLGGQIFELGAAFPGQHGGEEERGVRLHEEVGIELQRHAIGELGGEVCAREVAGGGAGRRAPDRSRASSNSSRPPWKGSGSGLAGALRRATRSQIRGSRLARPSAMWAGTAASAQDGYARSRSPADAVAGGYIE